MIEQLKINSCCLLYEEEQATGFLISPRQILTVTHLIETREGQTSPKIDAIFQSEVEELVYSANLIKFQPPLMILELEREVPFVQQENHRLCRWEEKGCTYGQKKTSR